MSSDRFALNSLLFLSRKCALEMTLIPLRRLIVIPNFCLNIRVTHHNTKSQGIVNSKRYSFVIVTVISKQNWVQSSRSLQPVDEFFPSRSGSISYALPECKQIFYETKRTSAFFIASYMQIINILECLKQIVTLPLINSELPAKQTQLLT